MTASPLGALVAAVAALLCLGAGVALALARSRADMLQAFSAGGFFAGAATIALGEGVAGAGVIGACSVLSIILAATARRVGEMAPSRELPFWARLGLVGVAVAIAAAVWARAPAADGGGEVQGARFDVAGAPELFAALALVVGVAGVAGALLGRGERGVLGEDPISDEPGALS